MVFSRVSRYSGQRVGCFGDAEVFSLSTTKLLVAGEGGIVATNSRELAEHIRLAREYGKLGDYTSSFAGLNARLPEFNAILAVRGLETLEDNTVRRNDMARHLQEQLEQVPGITFQHVRPEDRSSIVHLATLIHDDEFGLTRDELALALRAENIDTRKYHDPPVHTHRAYRHLSRWQDEGLTNTELVSGMTLSLPIWSHMDYQTVVGISHAIQRIHACAEEVRQATETLPTLK